jgi:hypothetical protein
MAVTGTPIPAIVVAVSWTIGTDLSAWERAVGPLLRADPVRHTTALMLLANLGAGRRYGDGPVLMGSWRPPGEAVTGAFLHTPPAPLLLVEAPGDAGEALAATLAARGHDPVGVTGSETTAHAFARAWAARTGAGWFRHDAWRLYRLGRLEPPDPPPSGRARTPGVADTRLLVEWWRAFAQETGQEAGDAAADVADRLGYGGIRLWEVDGDAVAVAAMSHVVEGMARVGPVYTPPGRRAHGYAAAVTVAVSAAAVDAGATVVCLFADADNALTNRLYPRIGFELVDERVELHFSPPPGAP